MRVSVQVLLVPSFMSHRGTQKRHGGSHWQEYAPGLFLADVNNDGNLDLFTVPADVVFLAGHRFWKFDVVSIVDENVFGSQ